MPPNPSDIDSQVEAYLHGLLTQDQARTIEALIERRSAWRDALARARRRRDLLQSLPASEASETLIRATLDRIAAQPAAAPSFRSRAALFAGLMAAAIALLASLQVHFDQLAPNPLDLRIVAQGELLAGSSGSLRVRLIDRRSGSAVAGAPIDIEARRPGSDQAIRLASVVTDRFGTAQPRLRWPGGQASAADLTELHVVARFNGQSEALTRRVRLVQSWRLDLATDRPIYEPGQAVQMRVLAWNRSAGIPIAAGEAVFSLVDPAGRVVGMESARPSRWGIAASSLALPEESPEGLYRVECYLGEAMTARSVEVRRRAAAWFRVDAQLDRPYYKPGQTLRGSLRADYFTGGPVKGAAAELRVMAPGSDEPIAGPVTLALDDSGCRAFELALPASIEGAQTGRGTAVTLVASVTDAAGRREVRRLRRAVSAEPLHFEAIPEAGELVPGVSNRVFLLATYPDGRPAQVELHVTGLDRGAERTLTTDAAGAAWFDLRPRGQEVALSVRASEPTGQSTRQDLYLPVGQPLAQGSLLVRTDRPDYRAGESVEVLVLGGGASTRGGEDEPVFIDLLQDGQTIQTQAIEMRSGKGVGRVDLPPDAEGTIRVAAYRMSPGASPGVAVQASRWIEVRPAEALHVTIEPERTGHRPGEEARLSLRLADGSGQAVQGALSLAAVDAAVIEAGRAQAGDRDAGGTEVVGGPILAPTVAPLWRQAQLARAASATGAGDTGDPMLELVDAGFIAPAEAEVARAIVREKWGAKRMREMVRSGLIPEQVARLLQEGEAAADGPAADQAGTPGTPGGPRPTVRLTSLGTPGAAPPMLTASSYPTKAVRVAAQRRFALALINAGWAVVAVGAIVAAFLAVLRRIRSSVAMALMVVALFAVVGTVLTAMRAGPSSYLGGAAAAELWTVGRALDRASEAGAMPMALRDGAHLADPAAGLDATAGAMPRLGDDAPLPRTLLWLPELITDAQGRASLSFRLPEAAAAWSVSATAINARGERGAASATLIAADR